MRILVVEDEQKVARALREGLEGEHYQVEVSTTGEDGFFRAVSQAFDVIILDLMLPGRSGLEILKTFRRQGHRTPVLVLTAKDAVQDRVAGLDGGADDYLIKPFAFAELLARLRALLRRGRPAETLRLRVADLEMDLASHKAVRGSEPIELTAREFELLEYLLRHEGELVSREMLTREVWKEPSRRNQSIVVDGEVPTDALVDPMLLREALVNVVDNAIKYSPAGAEIFIRVIPRQLGGPAIEIVDKGQGIDAEHHTRIFDRFYRVDEGRSRGHGGSGLALAIARWAVEANGGRIEVESERGRGSVFRIVLPCDESQPSLVVRAVVG